MRLVVLILLVLPPSLWAQNLPPSRPADELHKSSAWHALLHADRKGRSPVDDPQFFLAANGANDPRAEFHANLKAWNREPATYACRFPARAHWLRSAADKLGHATSAAPKDCPELAAALRKLKPDRAIVMFASDYLGNPASAFGHTFLVFEHSGRSRLLAQAVNYAARVDERGAQSAWKGLTGQLPGHYQILPYFEKVKEYNDLAQRDIWEYELDLDREEVRQLFRHVWELEDIGSDYWFLDENCAFNLLQLLDVARPGLDLRHQASRHAVLPVDVVKQIDRAGLVRKRTFRPALARDISERLAASSRTGKQHALALARGEADEDGPAASAEAIEAAGLILQAWKGSERIDAVTFDERYQTVLARRSELGSPTEGPPGADTGAPQIAPPPSRPPEQTPGSRQLSLHGGIQRQGNGKEQTFGELSFRLLGHSFLDRPEPGRSSTLELGRVRLRSFGDGPSSGLQLEELTVLELQSVSPFEPVFERESWRFRLGLDRLHSSGSGRDGALLGLLEAARGRGHGPFYLMAGGELRSDLHDQALFGPELTAGVFGVSRGGGLRSHLSASAAYHLGTDAGWHPEARWSTRLRLRPSLDLGFDAQFRSERVREARAGLVWNW